MILVDVHEKAFAGIGETTHLKVFDFIVPKVTGKSIGIERKTTSDLALSYRNKRLFTQLQYMEKNAGDFLGILLIESESRPFTRLQQECELKLRLHILTNTTIKIVDSTSKADTIRILKLLDSKKNVNVSHFSKPKRVTQYDNDEAKLRCLECLMGVSHITATKLLGEFRTLRNLANASPHEIQAIKGIGPDLVAKLLKFFR